MKDARGLPSRHAKRKQRSAYHTKIWLGGSPHSKKKKNYMFRRRLRRSRCSLLGDDHSSLLWRGVRSSTPRGGHSLKGRRRHIQLPYCLLSGIAKRALRGVVAKEKSTSQKQEDKKSSKRHM